ncbi:MAG TPA: hypothetical protein VGF69_17190 [Thermoanaerobaculia bacterium]|jgi:hypothetical protein
MRSTAARARLDRLVMQLKQWEVDVPPRARRFHEVRGELERDIHAAIPFWSFWIADDVVQRFRDRVGRLDAVADRLVALLRESDSLEAEVRRLADTSLPVDAELAAWLRTRCRDWLALLGRLGANCEREADVSSDQALYDDTESAVRLHHEAVHELGEADRILAALGTSVHAAELTAHLPVFRRRLYTDGSTTEWLDEIRGLIQPLRSVAHRVQDPPRELGEVGVILSEARNWVALLGSSEDVGRAIERLEERRFRVADWQPAEANEFVDEAQRLRASLLEQVQRMRDTMQHDLEEGVSLLRQACGDQPELDVGLTELSSRQSNRPQLFRDWRAQFEKVRHTFRSSAQTHIATLETRLAEARERLRGKLESLDQRPLSDEARKEVVLYGQDLAAAGNADGIDAILRELRTVNDIARGVDALERRVAHEVEELEAQQRELATRHAALEAEQSRVKGVEIDLTGIPAKIAMLGGGAVTGSLEQRRMQASTLAAELTAIESDFVDRCRARLDEQLRAIGRAIDVLRRAGAAPQESELPSIEAGATARAAAEALLEGRRAQNVLLRLARTAKAELEVRRTRALAELDTLRADDLGPAERQRAEQLRRDLTVMPEVRGGPVLDAIESTAMLLEQCGHFFDALQQEQRSARERLGELLARFREFSDEHLYRFCPELSDRVAALLYGIPEHPMHWQAVHRQLDRAAELFGRVETQARRLAAADADRAAETLRLRIRSGADGPLHDDARRLLAELDACGPETLVPALLRQRLLNASQRRI